MKFVLKIFTLVFMVLSVTACSSFNNHASHTHKNQLKTKKDLAIERLLTSGTWTYERQVDDCKDTNWIQNFYKNRYYKSFGAACLVPHAFTVDAENWHLKNQILYITNLSPNPGDDIIMRYGIDYLDQNKLVLSSGGYKYTFLKNQ